MNSSSPSELIVQTTGLRLERDFNGGASTRVPSSSDRRTSGKLTLTVETPGGFALDAFALRFGGSGAAFMSG